MNLSISINFSLLIFNPFKIKATVTIKMNKEPEKVRNLKIVGFCQILGRTV